MDLGNVLFIAALAYGLGVFWYEVLQLNAPAKIWRLAAYPFVGIYASEALLAPLLTFDPQFGGIHVISAVIGSLVAVVVDWVVTKVRQPAVAT